MSSKLTEQERADLVAYLDGELEAEPAQAIEAKLAQDPAAHAEVEQLRRAWELLDYLPKPEPSPSFTYRTLERVGPVVTGAQPKRSPIRLPRWAFGVGWAASVLFAMAGGYLGLTLLLRGGGGQRGNEFNDQDLVRDLRVIENKRMYELVDDYEFLKDLDHPDLFGEDPRGF
jgi:ferric-dicitrate binding protein FerR (iron transport regulator)